MSTPSLEPAARSGNLADHVQTLGAMDRDAVRAHLLALGQEDRRLRFGNPVNDDLIHQYVNSLAFETDDVFGIYLSRDDALILVGLAHMAYGNRASVANGLAAGDAEIGLSVLPLARGTGVGTALFTRAAERARIRYVTKLKLHYLVENGAMQHIARKAGMEMRSAAGETDAHLVLRTNKLAPPPMSDEPLPGQIASGVVTRLPEIAASMSGTGKKAPRPRPPGGGTAKIRSGRRTDHSRSATGRRKERIAA